MNNQPILKLLPPPLSEGSFLGELVAKMMALAGTVFTGPTEEVDPATEEVIGVITDEELRCLIQVSVDADLALNAALEKTTAHKTEENLAALLKARNWHASVNYVLGVELRRRFPDGGDQVFLRAGFKIVGPVKQLVIPATPGDMRAFITVSPTARRITANLG